MKISQIRGKLIAARTPSTEQGDISITVNQGEQDNPAVDAEAGLPPELSDPTASIADQPEVTDTLAEVDSDKADDLGAMDASAEMSDAEAGIAAGEEAVETLESYRAHIRALKKSGMPVSLATIESLNIGIEHAVGRFNLKAAEVGVPSTESFAANPAASLEALEKVITVSQEGIIESINDFVLKWGHKFGDLVTGVKGGLQKQAKRLDEVINTANSLNVSGELPKITNKGVIDSVELVTLDSKSGAEVLKKLQDVNGGISDMFTNRIANVEKAVTAAITSIANDQGGGTAQHDKQTVDKLRADLTNVLYADNRSIQFWVACSPVAAVALGAGAAAVAADKTAVGVAGGVVAGAMIGVMVGKAITGKAGTRIPAPFRKKKPGVVVLTEIPALSPSEVVAAAKSTKEAIANTLTYKDTQAEMAKTLQSIIDTKFKAAEGKAYDDAVNAGSDDVSVDAESRSASLGYIRSIVRDMYSIESAIIKGVRYSTSGVVDYLVESTKLAQQAEKASAAAQTAE